MNPSWTFLPFIFILITGLCQEVTAEPGDLITNVVCHADWMVFTISNRSTVYRRYQGNLVVFLKDATEASCKIAGTHSTILTPPGTFKITVAYKQCKTQVTPFIGTGGDPIGYYTNQHFIIAGTDGQHLITPIGATNYTAFVYCWIGGQAHADTGINGTSEGRRGRGGGTVVPTDAVEMKVTDLDGNPVYDVTLGDPLILTIRKKPDNLDYNATLPTYCYFTDHIGGHDTPTARIPFVVDKCPNDGIMNAFDYITKMEKINMTQYQVEFKAFNAASGSLGITCELVVCLNNSDGLTDGVCYKSCWDHPHPGPYSQSNPSVDRRAKRSAGGRSKSFKSKASIILRVKSPSTAQPISTPQEPVSRSSSGVRHSTINSSPVTLPGQMTEASIPLRQHLLFLYGCLGALGVLVLLLLFGFFCLCFIRQKSRE